MSGFKEPAMLGDGALTFKEFVMQEPLPLATIHRAVLEFLRDMDDAVLFGARPSTPTWTSRG